jgi:hypothetical protein
MMITHFGLSGPITLQMSLAIVDSLENGPVSVTIDLRPNTDSGRLGEQLRLDFDHHGKRSYRHILGELLPPKLVKTFIDMTGIPPDKPGSQITSEEQERLSLLLKSLRFNIKAPLSLAAAMVTAGGVSLDEIEPRTMASRLVAGLFFCGEVMDIDAETGGYNLQAAFSTGHLAGESAARFAAGVAR